MIKFILKCLTNNSYLRVQIDANQNKLVLYPVILSGENCQGFIQLVAMDSPNEVTFQCIMSSITAHSGSNYVGNCGRWASAIPILLTNFRKTEPPSKQIGAPWSLCDTFHTPTFTTTFLKVIDSEQSLQKQKNLDGTHKNFCSVPLCNQQVRFSSSLGSIQSPEQFVMQLDEQTDGQI